MPDPASQEGGATVVIGLRIAAEHEAAYEAWQAEIDAAAREFVGFQGSEVLPPQRGVQDEWVVVYRFDTADNLTRWLRSDVRAALLDQAPPELERVSENVVATPRGPARPVTVVVSKRVKPGHAPEFEAWQRGISNAAASFAGFLGSETFKPVPGVQDDWVVVFRFASAQTLMAWLGSSERQAWIDKAKRWVEGERIQTVGGGLGGWFPVASNKPTQPPRWKQSAAVLLALYPTVMLLSTFLGPRLRPFVSAPVNTFVSNLASVAILTWVLMPPTTRMLRPWLDAEDGRTTAVGAIGVALACAVMVVAFVAVG